MRLPKMSIPDLNIVKSYFYPVFWGTSDGESVAQSIKAVASKVAPGNHFADNFFTWGRNNSMFEDEEFVAAWHTNVETDADRAIVWRRYILACAGYHCVQLEGDFVECGAYKGVGMKTVIAYLGGVEFPKTFWGYDLFEHDATMAHHSMAEHGPELFGRVHAKFKDYSNVKLVKGKIPDAFENNSPDKIAYLHIDLNEDQADCGSRTSVRPSGAVRHDYSRRLRMGGSLQAAKAGRRSLVRRAGIPRHAFAHRSGLGVQALNHPGNPHHARSETNRDRRNRGARGRPGAGAPAPHGRSAG